jgi:methyl-accepting chemotaxis protein
MAGMLEELRRLTTAIGGSATSTAAMAAEITTGTEQMSATAHEIAETSDVLSQQSMEMAGTLQHVNTDATRLLAIAGDLATGAREGVERNAHLRLLADANRLRLDASAAALTTLATQVGSSAAAVEGVAAASEEIRAFVALVQKMARQSKLLALNAAMEAARAGEQGAGFAVVAGEVRRLAASSTDAAERTVNVVNEVLARVAESRASSAQTVQTVQTVLEASREGARTFGEVSDALEVAGRWTSSIADAAVLSSELVADMTRDLDSLAHGTEAFAAAMQQVAASSQEQSASTHEIATAAATLAAHARHLGELTGGFGGVTPAVVAAAGRAARAARPSPAGAAAPLHRRSPATRRATAVAAD